MGDDLSPALGVFCNSVSHLIGKIQSLTVSFEKINYPDALLVMIKPAWMDLPQDHLSSMPERCMAKIMAQGYGLCKVLIQA